MDFSELTSTLAGILQGDGAVFVGKSFENAALDERIFGTVGICGVKTENSFLSGEKTAVSCAVQYRLTVFGRECDGEEILAAGEGMLLRLLGSALRVLSAEGGGAFWNAKLARLQAEYTITLGCTLLDGGLSCVQGVRTASVGGLAFLAESYSFSRKRALSDEHTLSDGIYPADGGRESLSVVLKGFFLDASAAAVLDGLLAAGEALSVTLTGVVLPKMVLKEYAFSGEKNSASHVCTLVFSGAEVMSAE